MARESFVFHFEYIQDIPDELRSHWTMAIIDYAQTGLEPDFNDWRDVKVWNRIKDRIDSEGEKYQKRSQNLRQNTGKPSQPVQKSIQLEKKDDIQNLHFFDNSDSVTRKNTEILSVTEEKNSDLQKNLSVTESKTSETQKNLSVTEEKTCENENSVSVGVSVNESVNDTVNDTVNEYEFVSESETVSVSEQDLPPPYQESSSVSWKSPNVVHEEFFKHLHSEWVSAELPLSETSAQSFFHFSCRELKTALEYWHGKGLQIPEIMAAFNNYRQLAKLITSGGSWMKSVGGFDFFAKRILDWLPGSFFLDSYKAIQNKVVGVNTGEKSKDYSSMLAQMGIEN